MLPNIQYVVKNDLCTGCGICIDSCPSNAIGIIVSKGLFVPVINEDKCNNSKGCHRCYDACPGLGVDLVGISKNIYTDCDIKEDKLLGRYLQCYTGYSTDRNIRWHSASGGMVSQFLIWLLDNNYIDGAVVTKFDNSQPLMAKTFLATSKEDILDARGSKYGPVTMAGMAKEIKKAPGTRYVVVGLPCHIQGFRKLMSIDKKLREKVIGLFAIYCSSGRSFYLTEHVMKERGIKREELRYFAYRDEGCLGSMVAITEKSKDDSDVVIRIADRNTDSYLSKGEKRVYKDHYQNYYHPLRSFFIPRRCLFCIDHYGELGDVCFGDIHIEPYLQDKVGVNSVVVRSTSWKILLEKCKQDGIITLDEIAFETLSASQRMAFVKKDRNGAFVNLGEKIGWPVPEYFVDYLRNPEVHDVIDYIQNRVQQFLGRHKRLWWVVSKLKKDTSNLI